MKNKIFSAVVYREAKFYVAECPELGVASQGKTLKEALNNLKEASELYLDEFPHAKTQHPLLTTFEVAHA